MAQCVERVAPLTPAASRVLYQSVDRCCGVLGPPSVAGKTSASSGSLPRPKAMRSSSCWRRWSRSVSTTMSGEISRRPLFVLVALNRTPYAFVSSSASRTLISRASSRSTFAYRSAEGLAHAVEANEQGRDHLRIDRPALELRQHGLDCPGGMISTSCCSTLGATWPSLPAGLRTARSNFTASRSALDSTRCAWPIVVAEMSPRACCRWSARWRCSTSTGLHCTLALPIGKPIWCSIRWP